MSDNLINIYFNSDEKSMKIKNTLVQRLKDRDFYITDDPSDSASLNICIGGDGSFLRAVHDSNFSQIPFVGINTGHLGFYQEILISQIDSFIDNFINKKYKLTKLSLISAKLFKSGKFKELFALNEFAIKSDNSRICHLNVYIDEYHLERFAGDGLIVSTPSGSTAYNFSVGGSVLYQELKGYQLSPIAPINSKAYRSLTNSIVMPDNSVLKIVPIKGELNNLEIINDGVLIPLEDTDHIEFNFGLKSINKLVFNPNWYWINIKDKFL
ncbi:MAG: NAD(+)/NADH kinase [Tissierellia bacterium]|nr:NAD(+)/NADH kinase [Tissierellia bacterium]